MCRVCLVSAEPDFESLRRYIAINRNYNKTHILILCSINTNQHVLSNLLDHTVSCALQDLPCPFSPMPRPRVPIGSV